MIITTAALIIGGVSALVAGTGIVADKCINKKYNEGELEKTDENTLQQFDESAFTDEQKAEFEENADMSVSDYQKIIAQMQEKIKSQKSEYNASKKGCGLLGTVGDGIKSIFGGGSKKVKKGIESAEDKLDALIAKGENVTLFEVQEVYEAVMGAELDLEAVQSTLDSTDGSYTIQQVNADGTTSEVTYSKKDIVKKVQENAKDLQKKFDQTKSDQGIISKGLSFINNGLGIGTTSNEAQAQISAFIELAGSLSASDDDATFAAKFKSITGSELSEAAISNLMFDVDAYIAEYEANSSATLTELEKEQIKDYFTMMGDTPANSAIMDYESTQESVKKGFNAIATTAVVIGVGVATGGLALPAAAALGAGVNVALNTTDGLTSADGYSLGEAGMDALEGAVNGLMAGGGGKVAGSVGAKVATKITSTVGQKVATGAITGAVIGAGSSAANYTINTTVKNKFIDGDIVQNLGVEYTDDQGRNCIQYPVIDKNGDILYYETHVFDSSGNFVDKFTSNDFSVGGLISNTLVGGVTGAAAGAVAGGMGFTPGHTEGSAATRILQGTTTGYVAGTAGGAVSGAAKWVQSGGEGGASGLMDSMIDGSLEGGTTGVVAGFATSSAQVLGEKASPTVLKHTEAKYEKAQQRKIAADENAQKAADAKNAKNVADGEGAKATEGENAKATADTKGAKATADVDADGVENTKTKAQIRADKRVEKYQQRFEKQSETVKSYGYEDKAQEIIDKKADFDTKLENGEIDGLETRMDKFRAKADVVGDKAKAKAVETGTKIKNKFAKTDAKTDANAETSTDADGADATGKKSISKRIDDTIESNKKRYQLVKNATGWKGKGKAILDSFKKNTDAAEASSVNKTAKTPTDKGTPNASETNGKTPSKSSVEAKLETTENVRDDSNLNLNEKLKIDNLNRQIEEYQKLTTEQGHKSGNSNFCDQKVAELQQEINKIYDDAFQRHVNHEYLKLMRSTEFDGGL